MLVLMSVIVFVFFFSVNPSKLYSFLCTELLPVRVKKVTKRLRCLPWLLLLVGGGRSVMEVQHPCVGAPPGRRAVDAAAATETVELPEKGVAMAAVAAMYMSMQRVRRRHLVVDAASGERHGGRRRRAGGCRSRFTSELCVNLSYYPGLLVSNYVTNAMYTCSSCQKMHFIFAPVL